ncbi:SRPBCC domain-containing protein [Mobilicoccus pelagius]|uniref:Carbon monoxide dehydrogenase subunit G n=1 Tax=Mobilicoccus pelagius NBRC 104925 TaxID=1089455 RepID=H5UR23_9MICO|nr:SRPBCC domain-containing protein [Mobilicoccus pelagius]GAB48181.1 hypothetical protein MOPEL_067_00300 [Mobilicoccus pelagius NBRC 104925]
MKLRHVHEVDASVEEMDAAFTDVRRVGRAFPGAEVDSVDGDDFTGRLTTRMGPFTLTYEGEGRMTEADPEHHVAALEAAGGERRGFGRASMAARVRLTALGASRTRVELDTTLEVMGSPVDLGGGIAQRVSEPLVARFVRTLAGEPGAAEEGELDVARSVVSGLLAPAGRSLGRWLRR